MYLLSPSFQYFWDVDFSSEMFIIKDLFDAGKTIYQIKTGRLSLSLKGGSRSKEAIPKLAKRLSFEGNDHIRLINKGGLDCILNFKTGKLLTTT